MSFNELFQKVKKYWQNKPQVDRHAFIKWLLSYPPHISRAFREVSGFNLKYWLNLIDTWQKHKRTIDDLPYPCMDVVEKYLTVIKGCRLTTNQPEQATNTIYMLGGDIVFGMYVLDYQTSSSLLQKRCEEALPGTYKVVNLGSAMGDIWIDLLKFNELSLIAGDYVILQVSSNKFRRDLEAHRNIIEAMWEVCNRNDAKLVFLLVPEPNNIINPSKLERKLSMLNYQQLLSEVEIANDAKFIKTWTEPVSLISLRGQYILAEDLTPYFARPHTLGEIFISKTHLSPTAYKEIARIIFECFITTADSFDIRQGHTFQKEKKTNMESLTDKESYIYNLCRLRMVQNRFSEAKKMYENAISKYPTRRLFEDAFRLAYTTGDINWFDELVKQAKSTGNAVIADSMKIFYYWCIGKFKEAYLELKYRNNPAFAHLDKRYVKDIQTMQRRGGQVIIAAYNSPAGNILGACKYHTFADVLPNCTVRFTCDPRFHSLFKRSMPSLTFVPTKITNVSTSKTDFKQYNLLPNPFLSNYFDNSVWQEALRSDSVALCQDLMGDVINGYESFNGQAFLKADDDKVSALRERFKFFSKPLVGICWRSSLVDYNRANYVFLLDEIMDLFSVEGIQFVSLQYDGCYEWEKEKIESKHPGKLLHLTDIDQYNDFETTAALMKCMDLIISGPTIVYYMAGALGCDTWMLNLSAANSWMKNPLAGGRDAWFNSVELVEGIEMGNKASLLDVLKSKLENWKQEKIIK